MTQSETPTRRQVLRSLAAAGSAVALSQTGFAAARAEAPNKICAFTKPFESLSFDDMADTVVNLGFDGIEATVRDGGHIEPVAVEDELPRMVEALQKRGLEITIMASSVASLDQPHSEKTLRTAAGLGIKMYRLGYYMYDLDKPVIDQIEQIRPKLADLAALNRELGIAAVYQTHSGSNIFGAPIWDLHSLVKDHPPREIGVALDVAHTTVEGGLCWPLHYNLMRPHLGATYVKDFSWVNGKVRWGPLGVGHAASRLFAMIHASGFAGPISLHVEYLDRRGPDAVKNHVAAFRRDLETLHQWMSQ